MASSSYYYSMYKQKKGEVAKYEGNIKDLNKILSNLQNDLWDEIRNVNNEIDDLKEDLLKGVRHDLIYTSAANSIPDGKEKAATADRSLSTANSELQEEISRLTTLKNNAASDRDYYYRKYQEAKEEERQEALQAMAQAANRLLGNSSGPGGRGR